MNIAVCKYGFRILSGFCHGPFFENHQQLYTSYNVPKLRIADEDAIMDQTKYYEILHARNGSTDGREIWYSQYHVANINREIFDGQKDNQGAYGTLKTNM